MCEFLLSSHTKMYVQSLTWNLKYEMAAKSNFTLTSNGIALNESRVTSQCRVRAFCFSYHLIIAFMEPGVSERRRRSSLSLQQLVKAASVCVWIFNILGWQK